MYNNNNNNNNNNNPIIFKEESISEKYSFKIYSKENTYKTYK